MGEDESGIGIHTVHTTEGYVFCQCNSNGIAGASIQMGTNQITTDANGAYSLTNVAPGTYTVTVSATNYATLTTNLTITGREPVPDFYLTNTAFLVTPVLDVSTTDRSDADAISNTIWSATQVYPRHFADPVCVKIFFADLDSGLGQSTTILVPLPYETYVTDLMNSTNLSANDIAALMVI